MDQDARKLFILDTNVLLHEPLAIYSFEEHDIVVPMTVLEELDNIKDRQNRITSYNVCYTKLLRASLPELPDAKRTRYENELGLTPYNARELTAEVETFARFETLLAATAAKIGKIV